MKSMDRRMILRGFGGASIALPLLEAMGRPRLAHAQSAAIKKTGFNGSPKRFVAVFTPCGQGPDWLKNKNGPDGKLVLANALMPLARHKDKLLCLDGLNNQSALNDPAGIDLGHRKPFENLMSATRTVGGRCGGISVDQAIAKEIGRDTKFASIQLAAGSSSSMASGETGSRLPATSDPGSAFKKLFSDLKTDRTALDRVLVERKSALDGIKRDYEGFIKKLGHDDQLKVTAHLEGLREFESRLHPRTVRSAAPRPRSQPAVVVVVRAFWRPARTTWI